MLYLFEQPPKSFDLSSLDEWGEYSVLSTGKIPPHKTELFKKRVVSELRKNKFDPITDKLVLVGKTVRMVFITSAAISRYGPVDVLIYCGGGYLLRTLGGKENA